VEILNIKINFEGVQWPLTDQFTNLRYDDSIAGPRILGDITLQVATLIKLISSEIIIVPGEIQIQEFPLGSRRYKRYNSSQYSRR